MADHDGHTDEKLRGILSLRRVAVVGMSRNPAKAAHYVPRYLARHGFDIVPVNPRAREILGIRCSPSLADVDARRHGIDIVCVFRPSAEAGRAIDEAVTLEPRVIWLQEGIRDRRAEERAARGGGGGGGGGIDVVFDRCMMAEHRRLF